MLFLGYGCNINNHIYLSRLTSLSVPLHRDLLIELLNVHSLIGRLVCTSINTAFTSVILPSIEVLCVGERASRGPSQVLRRHIPALLSRLLGPVLELGLLPGFAGCSNFLLTGSNFTSIEVLNELVHFRDPFVVFLEGANLAIEQAVLLVAHLEVLLEALDVGAQVLVLLRQLPIEALLKVQVTLHVIHFPIPKVQLVSLLAIVLFHEGDTA